ncbi:MAG: hypothetical protein V3T83_07825 [Acidobacteriota bacterium]
MLNRFLFFIYVLYCFEVGLFLLTFPWMQIWSDNALLSYFPEVVRGLLLSNYVRGAVSGLGLANLFLGLREVIHFQRDYRKARMESADSLRNL